MVVDYETMLLILCWEILQNLLLIAIVYCFIFSQVIKDIAQHILSFMKSNCTKEGHTYWLFKGMSSNRPPAVIIMII